MVGCDDKQRQKLVNAVLFARNVLSCSMLHIFLSKCSKSPPQYQLLGLLKEPHYALPFSSNNQMHAILVLTLALQCKLPLHVGSCIDCLQQRAFCSVLIFCWQYSSCYQVQTLTWNGVLRGCSTRIGVHPDHALSLTS